MLRYDQPVPRDMIAAEVQPSPDAGRAMRAPQDPRPGIPVLTAAPSVPSETGRQRSRDRQSTRWKR